MFIWFLFFYLLMRCITLDDSFANILLRNFASMFVNELGLYFSVLCDSFVWFWYQGVAGVIELV